MHVATYIFDQLKLIMKVVTLPSKFNVVNKKRFAHARTVKAPASRCNTDSRQDIEVVGVGAAHARRTGQHPVKLSPRSRRIERSVYTFIIYRTLRTNYQRQRFEGCPIQ